MENFPNLMREKIKQIQESQRVPIKRNQKRPTTRHIIIKMAKFKNKGRILKAEKKKRSQGSFHLVIQLISTIYGKTIISPTALK